MLSTWIVTCALYSAFSSSCSVWCALQCYIWGQCHSCSLPWELWYRKYHLWDRWRWKLHRFAPKSAIFVVVNVIVLQFVVQSVSLMGVYWQGKWMMLTFQSTATLEGFISVVTSWVWYNTTLHTTRYVGKWQTHTPSPLLMVTLLPMCMPSYCTSSTVLPVSTQILHYSFIRCSIRWLYFFSSTAHSEVSVGLGRSRWCEDQLQ